MKIKKKEGLDYLHSYEEKDLDDDGIPDIWHWDRNDFDFLTENYKYLFAEIGFGTRLSYVMPKYVHQDNGATWYSHPLSVGKGNFWKNAMDAGLDTPSGWLSYGTAAASLKRRFY